LAAIPGYLQEVTAHNAHWAGYQDALAQLATTGVDEGSDLVRDKPRRSGRGRIARTA